MLALGANHGERHLHVRVLHALLRAEAEVDLLRERNRERIALHRSSVLAALRVDGSEGSDVRVTARRGLCERARPEGCVARPGLVEPAFAGEAPGAVDEDADADSLALGVAQVVDLAVLRDDVLAPQRDRTSVRIRRSST